MKVLQTSLVLILCSSFSYAEMSDEDVRQQVWDDQPRGLHSACASAASRFCGKLTRSMMINQNEFKCLFNISQRMTRNGVPDFDGTQCDKTIKESAEKVRLSESQVTDSSDIKEKVWENHQSNLHSNCAAVAGLYCGKVTRSSMINKSEYSCLYDFVTRNTRNGMPGLDGSRCSDVINDAVKVEEQSGSQGSGGAFSNSSPGCAGGVLSDNQSTISCPDGSIYVKDRSFAGAINQGRLMEDFNDGSDLPTSGPEVNER